MSTLEHTREHLPKMGKVSMPNTGEWLVTYGMYIL